MKHTFDTERFGKRSIRKFSSKVGSNHVQIQLSPDLKTLFDAAWLFLPTNISERFTLLIEAIYEVDSKNVDGYTVKFTDGSIHTNKGDVPAWCAPNKAYTSVCICLSDKLVNFDSAKAISKILHEFAHVIEITEDGNKSQELKDGNRSELAANLQAIAWVMREQGLRSKIDPKLIVASLIEDANYYFAPWIKSR